MGLLDDAIHEHLELKRRRGADPGEVAREQREALDSVVPGEPTLSEGDFGSPDELVDGSGEVAPAGAAPAEDLSDGAVEPHPGSDFSSVGQETAELDMQAVLDEDQDAPEASATAGPAFAGSARGISSPALVEEDSLEWEMPAGPTSEPAAEVGYQEQTIGHGDHGTAGGQWDAEQSRQTPGESSDLNGDIPGQERLSFD